MLIKGTDVIGLKIISIKEGREINKIEDLIYDPDTKQIKALVAASSGLFSSSKYILPGDVKNIGQNAIIIESEDKLKKISEIDEKIADIARNNTYITKTKVVTEDGTELGHISDMIFDTSTGNVEKIEISRGLKDIKSGKKYINIDDIITIGKDVIIVKMNAQTTIVEQDQEKEGGVEGFIKEGTEKIKDSLSRSSYLADEASEKGEEFKQKTLEKTDEAREQAGEIKGDIQKKVEELKDTAKTKLEEVQTSVDEKRKNSAIGRYLTINILSFSDEFIARRGDLITHNLLEEAEKNGMLNQVLNNTSDEPIEM